MTSDKALRRFYCEPNDIGMGDQFVECVLASDYDALAAERDELNASAMEMDAKYWAEFNRHEQTKAELIREKKKVEKLKAAIADVLHERYSDDDPSAAPYDPLMILLEAIDKESEGAKC